MLRIRHSHCQPSRRHTLVVTHRYLAVERKYKLIAHTTIAMHLNDQVVTIGTLLLEETLRTFRVSIHFVNTWIPNKLHKPVNVA